LLQQISADKLPQILYDAGIFSNKEMIFTILKLLAIMVPRLIYYGYAMQLTAKLKAKKNDQNYTKEIKTRVIRNNNNAEMIPYSSKMIICNVSFSLNFFRNLNL
jgi:hypothetical protein